MSCRKLCIFAAASMSSTLCRKLFCVHPFHFYYNVLSTEAHSQSLFSQFASSKLNMSEAKITRVLKSAPSLQKLRTLANAEKIFHSLMNHGCTGSEAASILRKDYELIGCTETILEPKLRLMEDFGFVGRDLAKLMTRNSYVLSNSLKNNILPTMEFLKNAFQSQDVLRKALLRNPRLLTCSLEKTLKPSLAFWEGWGFSGKELVSFLQVFPGVLTRTSLIPAQVDLINKIGADRERKLYKYIVSVVAMSRLETLEAKIDNFKLCGLKPEEIWQLLGASPLLLCLSMKNVREKMNFLVNNMQLPGNYVLKNTNILVLSLAGTLRPRFLVWEKIKTTSDFNPCFSTVLSMTEAKFVSKIIKGHPESKALWTIYENALSSASKRSKDLSENIILDGGIESQHS